MKDDLDETDPLPPLPQARDQAVATNPDVKAANATVDQAKYEVNIARYGYVPTISFDFFYGLNSNQFALHNPEGQLLLGNAAQFTVEIPVWNWGTTKSKVKQAEMRQDQARLRSVAYPARFAGCAGDGASRGGRSDGPGRVSCAKGEATGRAESAAHLAALSRQARRPRSR